MNFELSLILPLCLASRAVDGHFIRAEIFIRLAAAVLTFMQSSLLSVGAIVVRCYGQQSHEILVTIRGATS